ncbi:MAG TPA: hypothetical protein VFF42_09040, partial [Candidatus Eremiobacteraceae bacterium]|nr:hypothetical protein [Candidatus Eremiobacteraceae bacterium]
PITTAAAITSVAAATSSTAVTAAAAATAAMTAATTAVPTPTARPSPAATCAFCLRPGFVNYQIATAKILAVQGINGAIRIFVIGYFDECKTARLSSKTVTN